MKNTLSIVCYLFCLNLCLVSCKKETKDSQTTITSTESNTSKLCNKTWRPIAYYQTNNKNNVKINNFIGMGKDSVCYKSIRVKFSTPDINVWTNPCDTTNKTSTGKWKFINNETQIVTSDSTGNDTSYIGLLNVTTLKIYKVFKWGDTTFYYNETYVNP